MIPIFADQTRRWEIAKHVGKGFSHDVQEHFYFRPWVPRWLASIVIRYMITVSYSWSGSGANKYAGQASATK